MTMASKLTRQEKERQVILKYKYLNRITTVRFGKEALNKNQYALALKHFIEYMNVMSEIKNCQDFYSLTIHHFDKQKDLTEMMMISHLFFEIARLYDSTPKFQPECKRALDQFVHFSVNQPYQVINSEMARKNIRKTQLKNADDFRSAYEQIYIQSKKCYVVTYCMGDDHPVTRECREFKDWLLNYHTGQKLVRLYYRFSSVAVEKFGQNPFALFTGRYIARPLLVVFSKTVLPAILKKCKFSRGS